MQYLILIYIATVILFAGYSIAGIYHLWRFGYSGDLSKAIIIVYSVVSVGVIIISLSLMSYRLIVG
jgi:hypothetical protein